MPTFLRHNRYLLSARSGALLIACSAYASFGQVRINEFLFRDPDTRLEFVEIFNAFPAEIDLRDFELSDERREPVAITLESVEVGAGGYAVLVRDTASFDLRFRVDRIQPRPWPSLNNGGDAVLLWSGGKVVDSVSFDGSWGTTGRSMERIDPSGPAADRTNWRVSEDPSGATPGKRNSVFSPDLIPPKIVEVEEWRDGSVIVYVSEPLDPTSFKSALFRFVSGDRPLSSHLSFDRTQVVLQPWPGADLGSLTVEGLVDASGNRGGLSSATIARQPRPADMILNEILFEPNTDAFDGRPDQQEFVEVRSTASYPLALRGVFLSGRVNEKGTSDTLHAENRPMRLHAGGFGVFYAKGSSSTDFRQAFPSLPPDSVSVLAPVLRQTLLLDNGGDTVRLHSAGGEMLDELTYASSWHLPERSSTRGVSIERISQRAPSDDASNWTSSVSTEGGTPGRENSVASTGEAHRDQVVSITPSVFSPDGDGFEDFVRIDVATGRPASTIAVWIFDSTGRLVRSVTEALTVGPESSLVWNGRDDADRPVPTGIFIVYVEAVDTSAGDVRRFKKAIVVA